MPERDITAGNARRSGLWLAVLVPSFYLGEWLLAGAAATTFSFLKYQGLPLRQIWLIFWGANLILSAAILLGNDRLQMDITLMQTLRRVVDATQRRSRWLGLLLEAALFLRLLLWNGACQLLIFFRARVTSRTRRSCLFVAASGLQMLVWTKIYDLGYESVTELVSYLKG